MAFPFQSIPHREYPNTFLVNTSVGLYSDIWDGLFPDSFSEKYPLFVKRFFGLTKDTKQFMDKKELSVSAQAEEITYSFRPNKVNLVVGRKNYHTFVDSIIPELFPLKDFIFGVMERDSIENLMVRKLNIFSIQADSVEEIKEKKLDIYKYIFSPDFINSVSIETAPSGTSWILDYRKVILHDNTDELTVRMGISRSRGSENIFNIVLDSSARCIQSSSIGEGAVDRILLRLNDQLFNSYHWCVSDNIMKLMKSESEK